MKTLKTKSNTLYLNDTLRKRSFYFLFSGILILSFVYMFFLCNTIYNIIERKNIEDNIRNLSSTVSQMELDYLSLNEGINLSLAKDLGLSEPKNVYFSQKSLVGNLARANGI